MSKIFQFLCGCLAQIGRPFSWNYEKASVYICIHLWPLLCVVMALVMLGISVSTTNPLCIAACIIYFLFNVFGYWAVIKHYYPGCSMSLDIGLLSNITIPAPLTRYSPTATRTL